MKHILLKPLSLADAEAFGLISERVTANRLEVPISTLRSWRTSGRGPMTYQINNLEFAYLDTDIAKFEDVCLDGFNRFFGDDYPDVTQDHQEPIAESAATKHLSFRKWLQQQESRGGPGCLNRFSAFDKWSVCQG